MARRTRKRSTREAPPPFRLFASSGPLETMTVVDEKRWLHFASQAFLWSRLLLEIPRRVELTVQKARAQSADLQARLDLYPNDAGLNALDRAHSRALSLRAEIAQVTATEQWACTTARLVCPARTWQASDVAVEFALCREGDVKIHAVNIVRKHSLASLPNFVEVPQVSEAQVLASTLVDRAIDAVLNETAA